MSNETKSERLDQQTDGQKCRCVLPAKTQVPGVGVVGYMDGLWFERRGLAVCTAGTHKVIVHPAQALITLL